ncbi:MAG: recombinase family protein, partial [Planctomycetota bacterium]
PDSRHAVAYMRKSTEEQAQSIDLQQASIERGARQQGYEVTAWFKDEGVSGTIPMDERPGGRKLFEHLRTHPEVTAVFFDDITRMERSPDLHCYSHRLYEFHSKYKVVAFFVSDQQRSDSPHMSDFLICIIKGLESSEYSKKPSFKTARGQIAVVQNGCLSGRQPAYGMDRLLLDVDGTPLSRWVVLDDGFLQKFNPAGTDLLDKPIPPLVRYRHETDERGGRVPVEIRVTEPIPKTRNQRITLVAGRDETKVETVRFIFEQFVNTSIGLRGLAGVLNKRGIPPPCTNGGPRRRHARPGQAAFWRPSTVRYILTNPAYYGAITFNRRSLSKFWRIENTSNGDNGWQQIEQDLISRRSTHFNGQQHWVQNVVRPEAAIVSQDVFERAQRKLACRSRGRTSLPRDRRSRFLLSGLLRCQCGSRMNGVTLNRTKEYKNGNNQTFTYRRYVCSTHLSTGGAYCSHNAVDGDALETFVLRQTSAFLASFISPANVARKAARLLKTDSHTPRSAQNTAAQAELEQIESNLAGLPPLGQIAPALRAAFQEQQRVWDDRCKTIRRELATTGKPRTAEPQPDESMEEAKKLLTEIEGLSLSDDACRLREILNRCIAEIRLEFAPVQQGRRTLHQLQRGELAFFGQPGRLSLKGNRGGPICPLGNNPPIVRFAASDVFITPVAVAS